MNKNVTLIAPALAALVLSACVQDDGQTVEKQAYKGAVDTPAEGEGSAEERTAALSERFNLIQTDR